MKKNGNLLELALLIYLENLVIRLQFCRKLSFKTIVVKSSCLPLNLVLIDAGNLLMDFYF